MARLRGTPKNMNQGIYWVQRANSNRGGGRSGRQVGKYTVEYNNQFEIFAYDHNGDLPKKYANQWVKENPRSAVELAEDVIKIINETYRFDHKLICKINSEYATPAGKPKVPVSPQIDEKVNFKSQFTHSIPLIGNWLKQRHEREVIEHNKKVDSLTNAYRTKLSNYNDALEIWLKDNQIVRLSDIDTNELIARIESHFELDMPNRVKRNCKVEENNLILPFIHFPVDEKKPSGPNKALNKILIKNKLKRELAAEQTRCMIALCCGAYNIVKALGYTGDFSISYVNAKRDQVPVITNDKSYQRISNALIQSGFSFDVDFL